MGARPFVEEILVNQLNVREVCMGYNAHFGYRREGDRAMMRRLAGEYGIKFEEIEPIRAGGDYVSSSRLRKLVQEGRLDEAALCLGHAFRMLGRVIPGAGRGAALGYPTANLETAHDIFPPRGVYPVLLRVIDYENKAARGNSDSLFTLRSKGEWLCGVLNYGLRPTFKTAQPETDRSIPEVHLLDFQGDLYGKRVEIEFYPRLREEKVFEGQEALKRQISKDIEESRRYLDFRLQPKTGHSSRKQ